MKPIPALSYVQANSTSKAVRVLAHGVVIELMGGGIFLLTYIYKSCRESRKHERTRVWSIPLAGVLFHHPPDIRRFMPVITDIKIHSVVSGKR